LIYLTESAFDTVLFLDAVEFGAVPGSVVLLDASEMTTRFPQVSTHKLSLGLLAQMIEANGRTKVWLLGVQPASLKPGEGLSPRVAATVEGLIPLLTGDCAEVMA
jgi:hydrogenase 3 maturation protease